MAPVAARPCQPDADLWRHRRVAVTGATGFLGSHLTKQLVDLGANVVVIARDSVPPTPVADWGDKVTLVRGAVEDQLLVERVLGEYEVRTLFHLAAQTQVGVSNQNPVSTWESNVMGTAAVLEAARRSPGIQQIVTASSDKAYGTQPVLPYDEDMPLIARNPYDVSKACSDLIATSYFHTWGVPVCITRCGNFFGPGDVNWERLVPGVIRWLLAGVSPIIRSDGTLVRDYLYVVDGALAYLQLAECLADDASLAGEAFNFSTETPVTVLELVDVVQRVAGTHLVPEVRGTAANEIDAQHLSAAKARKVLGWSPGWSLEEALVETVEWYRAFLGKGTP